MELPELVLRPIRAFKEMLDLEEEPPILTSQLVQLRRQLAELRSRLDETRKLSLEKDELIARLQAAGAIKDDMIVEGSAWFVKKAGNILDGPYCTCCFEQKYEKVRIVPAARPEDADGPESEWVQCSACRTPFRSSRVGEFLNAPAPATAETDASAEETKKPVRKAPALRKTTRVAAAARTTARTTGSTKTTKKAVRKAPARRKTTRVNTAARATAKTTATAKAKKKAVRKAPAKRRTTRVSTAARATAKTTGSTKTTKKATRKAPAKRKTTRVSTAARATAKTRGTAKAKKKSVRKAPARRKTTRVARVRRTKRR